MQQLGLLLLDFAATYLIAAVALGLSIVYVLWTLLDYPLLIDAPTCRAAIKSFPIAFYLPLAPLLNRYGTFSLVGPTGIFFFSTFMASVWVWLVPAIGIGVRGLRPLRTEDRLFPAIEFVTRIYITLILVVIFILNLTFSRLAAVSIEQPPGGNAPPQRHGDASVP